MMKKILTLTLFVSLYALAIPEPVVTVSMAYSGYGTIGGKLASSNNDKPVGISVRNGNVTYATTTDLDGRWAVVIKQLTTSVDVQSWDPSKRGERSPWKTYRLEE